MNVPKNYFHDRTILLLLSINSFLVVFTIASLLLRANFHKTGGYIVGFRPTLGLNAYQVGSIGEILSFVAFVLLVFGLHSRLSMITYHARRHISVTILGLASLLLLLALIVSYSLLTLR
jgi:hypothetical protein